jgi:cobalt-zinc-cadmium efflux system outer membrane protein
VNVGYSEICNSATCSSAPALNLGLAANLPVLYQQQGEIQRAESNVVVAQRSFDKVRAQVLSDVSQGWAGYTAAREQIERMEGALLAEYKRSRDLAEIQYQKGAASLVDFLFAERAYVGAELEYHQDLASFWTSIYQLEQATNQTLH